MMEILHAPCENCKEKCPLPQHSGKMPSCHCHHYTALCAAGTVVPGAWKREKEKHPGYFLCSLQPLQVPFAAPWARKKSSWSSFIFTCCVLLGFRLLLSPGQAILEGENGKLTTDLEEHRILVSSPTLLSTIYFSECSDKLFPVFCPGIINVYSGRNRASTLLCLKTVLYIRCLI